MTYDLELAKRIRKHIGKLKNLEEKKMFGGVGFLFNGNLVCGVHKNDLILRVAPDLHESLLARPHARVFDMTGKPMKGWLLVDSAGLKTEAQLSAWITEGMEFVRTLPVKKK